MSQRLNKIGEIVHYYTNINVAVVELSEPLEVGTEIAVKGTTTDFTQTVDSMEIEHKKVERAEAGESIGLKVRYHAREGDIVYKLE